MVYVLILFGIIILDQVTKVLVASQGAGWSITIIPEVFSFTYTVNRGAAFSFLGDAEWGQTFFFVITIIILPVLFIAFLRLGKNRKWLKTTIILILAGTIGNFIDRVVFKGVTDFIYVHFFANFNVADISLTVGAIMLIFWFLFLDDEALFRIGKKKNG